MVKTHKQWLLLQEDMLDSLGRVLGIGWTPAIAARIRSSKAKPVFTREG